MNDHIHHLAQGNIARALAPLDDPLMEGFVAQLGYINSVADRSPGFVWRLQSEAGDATSVRVFDDPLIIVNMSVWVSVDHLYDYAFRSEHLKPLQNRRSWFSKLDRPHSVLWWIPAGKVPDVTELCYRLDLLRDLGATPAAFTFGTLFDPHGNALKRAPDRGHECGV